MLLIPATRFHCWKTLLASLLASFWCVNWCCYTSVAAVLRCHSRAAVG
jgi:hypothetical protein